MEYGKYQYQCKKLTAPCGCGGDARKELVDEVGGAGGTTIDGEDDATSAHRFSLAEGDIVVVPHHIASHRSFGLGEVRIGDLRLGMPRELLGDLLDGVGAGVDGVAAEGEAESDGEDDDGAEDVLLHDVLQDKVVSGKELTFKEYIIA